MTINAIDKATALYESARPIGGTYFNELPEDLQDLWINHAESVLQLEDELQDVRKELDDTKKAVNDIKGKPPGWYHTMETDWATQNFNFPAEPEKHQEHTATDGSKWKYQWCTEWWDLVEYAPEEGEKLPALGSPEALRFAADVGANLWSEGDTAVRNLRCEADRVERKQAEKAKHDTALESAARLIAKSAGHDWDFITKRCQAPGADVTRAIRDGYLATARDVAQLLSDGGCTR